MLHTCSINLRQRGKRSNFVKNNVLSQKDFFAIDYQESTRICLLQPKIFGRNYLCTNNRYTIFLSFITINNTVHHLCKIPVP